jgi:hypothetical protein
MQGGRLHGAASVRLERVPRRSMENDILEQFCPDMVSTSILSPEPKAHLPLFCY